MSRTAWIALSAVVVALVAAGVAAGLLVGGDGKETNPGSDGGSSSPPQSFSLPLTQDPSALAVARHTGNLLVGIAARPGGPVEVAALRAEKPVATEALDFDIDGRRVAAQPCGTGCSRIQAPVLAGSPSRLTLRTGASTVSFDLPGRPPPSGARLFARAQRTMDGLEAFRFTERLSSGRGGVVTGFAVQAPNRLRFSVPGGFRSVIIGKTRWDFREGRWERARFPGLTVAGVLMWHQARHAKVVGRRPDGITELAAFGLKPVPAWFTLSVAPTGRVVEAEMIAPSHFMLHRYSDFNGDISITPPK